MLHHIVMWKLKERAEGQDRMANVAQMRRLLEGCSAVVPGIGRFEVGQAAPGLGSTFDLVLYSEFEDAAALAAYQHHPQHEAVVPFIRAVTETRQCVDYVL
ncbi:Dabb family protein [Robbsia sp. Bb-Pol-6]|uniref:Dabb family protein n=1 Tax=Robbsia betulipollinis TaxID=2981849 RepID=A0ABT3ZNL5_9BURK|nr:Dabb family protein [Robbsia betulipollinis]MCY0388120.1 Dabb family protein [Robbsia betulipollinis]